MAERFQSVDDVTTRLRGAVEDESVEVTPLSVRLRKVELSAQKRQTATSRRARGLAPV